MYDNLLRVLSKRSVQCALFVVVGVTLYGFTLNYPFIFDGRMYVMNNPLIRSPDAFYNLFDLDGFISTYLHRLSHPSQTVSFVHRPLAYLTFFFNYLLGGDNPAGYRMFNIALHISNALLLYLLLLIIIRRRYSQTEQLSIMTVPFFAALIFLVHPLQTESVTYIVQRFALLGAFFYLATMILYVRSSGEGPVWVQRSAYAGSIILLIMGLQSRESLLTVPFALIMVEIILLRQPLRGTLIRLAPHIACVSLLPLRLLQLSSEVREANLPYGISMDLVNGAYPRFEYAITQLRVVLSYIRLLVLPYNQNFDPDYPLFRTVLHPEIIISILIWMIFIWAGVSLLRRRERNLYTDLTAFSIFWFPLGLSVSSSFFPQADLMFEHRTYLSSLAFCAGSVAYVHHLASRGINFQRSAVVGGLCLVVSVFSVLTVQRNLIYSSRSSLWRDTVSKSPNKYRPYFARGNVAHDNGNYSKAIRNYKKALELAPEAVEPYISLGSLYMDQGKYQKAIDLYEAYLKTNPPKYLMLTNLAVAYARVGRLHDAIDAIELNLQVKSNDASLLSYYSELNLRVGNLQEAEIYLIKAEQEDELDPTVDLSSTLDELEKLILKSVELRVAPVS